MRFDPAAVTALPQEQVLKLINEAHPTASSSLENPPSKTTASEWLNNYSSAVKESRIIADDIAAAIGIQEGVVTTVTCFTNLQSAKCAAFLASILTMTLLLLISHIFPRSLSEILC